MGANSRSRSNSETRKRYSLPSRILQRLRSSLALFRSSSPAPKYRSVRDRPPTPHPSYRVPMRDSLLTFAGGDNPAHNLGTRTPGGVGRGRTPVLHPSPRQLALEPDAADLDWLEEALENQWTLRFPHAASNAESPPYEEVASLPAPGTVRIRMIWFPDEDQR